MNGDYRGKQGHGDEMHPARTLVSSEQRDQPLQLNGLPYRNARKDENDAAQNQGKVCRALRGVVHRQVLMRKAATKRVQHVVQHGTRREREELAAEVPREHAVRNVDQSVQHEKPHRGKVPLQRAREPAPERERVGKRKRKQRRCVVDAPAARDHHCDCQRIDPVRHAHGQRMQQHGLHRRLISSTSATSAGLPARRPRSGSACRAGTRSQ